MTSRPAEVMPFDVGRLRRDFPILTRRVRGRPLIYLDNAATTQKPRCVIEAVADFYTRSNANIHRGIHALSEEATARYEETRRLAARFLNASSPKEIVFTKGTTEAINLVAASYARPRLKSGDEILITHLEHHANIVPWQMVCQATGARLRVAPIDDTGAVILEEFEALLSERTAVVALAHQSNALGTVNPVARMCRLVRENSPAVVLVDGAQAVAHRKVDLKEIDCDFYAFSGHKLFGPTGVGVLYGRYEILKMMEPYQGGGDMIRAVTFERTLYKDPPERFEAGTPPVASVIGLGRAFEYLSGLDRMALSEYEDELLEYGTDRLREIDGLRMIGTAKRKSSVISFVIDGVHPHDLGTILDVEGIAVRAGHHCAQPVMERFGVPATVRASLAFYNTRHELDRLVEALDAAKEMF